MIEFEESGLRFTFPETDCFRIEKDDIISSREHIKACECVAKITHKGRPLLHFIEAKSSAPREPLYNESDISYQGGTLPDRWSIHTNFDKFIDEICQKFQDSYALCHAMEAMYHGKEAADRIAAGCRHMRHDNVRFVLIMGGNFQEDWCAPLNDAIRKRMRHFINAWNIADISIRTFTCASAAAASIPVTPI